jgi:hypothetical protein
MAGNQCVDPAHFVELRANFFLIPEPVFLPYPWEAEAMKADAPFDQVDTRAIGP